MIEIEQYRWPTPMKARWQVMRAGIQNVWEYDDQRFALHRGRLMLRGRNESGKTKALELLFPFLLDASLSPQRLDPFGSMARKMAWNFFPDDGDDKQRIGFVWLELGRVDGGVPLFFTIGAHLRAYRSDKSVEATYFSTSLRMDRDLSLVDGERHPLTTRQLREALAAAGTVYEGPADYRAAVNRELFGVTPDQYDALINTLLQLRRPQLAKSLDPDEVSKFLTQSLPPLDRTVIDPLAEGFERLDADRRERQRIEEMFAALTVFGERYRRYAKATARAKAVAVTTTDSALRRAADAAKAARGVLTDVSTSIDLKRRERNDEHIAKQAHTERLETLLKSDAYRAVEQLEGAQRELKGARGDVGRDADRVQREARALEEQGAAVTAAENAVSSVRKEAAAATFVADDSARAAQLTTEHAGVQALLKDGQAKGARGAGRAALDARRTALKELAEVEKRVTQVQIRVDGAIERQRVADETLRQREDDVATGSAVLSRVDDERRAAVERWLGGLVELGIDHDELLGALDEDAAVGRAHVGRAHASAASALAARVGQHAAQLTRVEAQMAEVEQRQQRLRDEPHPVPDASPWRRRVAVSGAPLYMLCEPIVDEAKAGALEGALEAAGLLDAWVTPDGALLDLDSFDSVIVPRPAPVSGRTLADALRPTPAGGVAEDVIQRVLRSIAWPADDVALHGETAAFVTSEGRFGIGPLHGTFSRDRPRFLGATAREEERQRQLAELAATEAELREEEAFHVSAAAELARRQTTLDAERDGLPDETPIVHARIALEQARTAAANAAEQRTAAVDARKVLEEELGAEVTARDRVAAERGLVGWLGALDACAEKTQAWWDALQALLSIVERSADAEQRARERRDAVEGAKARVVEAELAADASATRVAQLDARVTALREATTATREEVVKSVSDARQALRGAEDREAQLGRNLEQLREQHGGASQTLTQAQQEHEQRENERTAVSSALHVLGRTGMLDVLGLELAAGDWTVTEALALARKIQSATESVDESSEACERLENAVTSRWQELQRALGAEITIALEKEAGIQRFSAVRNRQQRTVRELTDDLGEELNVRARLLDEKERALFESFLSGEAHDHVRARLRAAADLVKRMSGELERRPTPSGKALRIRWQVSDGAPAGAREAIDLWRKTGSLLTQEQRDALSAFLARRLEEARLREEAGTLGERLGNALDYRRWFEFTIEVRDGAKDWSKLTKKKHAPGSGGEKAMLLHLPLFAAAAAFYDSASPTSARIVALDEAFAGIDRGARGDLMGLIAAFDLDFIMTSYEEWGFYEQLDGIATYHLSRDPSAPGVLAEWFVWDGQTRIAMG